MACERLGEKIAMSGFAFELASEQLSTFADDIQNGDNHRGHYFWVIPASVLLNLTKIILAPVIALVNLLAAAIFGMVSCTSWGSAAARNFLLTSVRTMTDGLYTAGKRLIFPAAISNYCVTQPMETCLGLEQA